MKTIKQYVSEMIASPFNWTGLTVQELIRAGRIDKEGAAGKFVESVKMMDENEIGQNFPDIDIRENGEIDISQDGKLMNFYAEISRQFHKQIFELED